MQTIIRRAGVIVSASR